MRRSERGRKPNNRGSVKTDSFTLKGGLNLVDAPITIPDGMVLGAVNYELLPRNGYRRIDGFERFDGQNSPSDASYWIVDYTTGADPLTPFAVPPDGSVVIGLTSGATADVLTVVESTGDWQTGDAAGYLVLTNVVGTFQDAENLAFAGGADAFTYEFSTEFA